MFDAKKVNNREAFFLYINSAGDKSTHAIVNLVEKDDYIQGYSVTRKGYRTYRKDRVISMFDSSSELDSFIASGQINDAVSSIETEIPRSQLSKNKSLDICFTGFDKTAKDELSRLATSFNLTVRTGVTSKLAFLCCGANAGWRKIEDANTKGSIILSEEQFKHFVKTGEIPYETGDISIDEIKPESSDIDKLNTLREGAATTFRTIRSSQRSNALIAQFVDGFAVGWKFAVKSVFRDALDIKLTTTVFDGYKFESWTQGNRYSFHRGDTFYSSTLGYTDWPSFLKLEDAIVLQVKFECYAGYETIATLDGSFSGYVVSDNLINSKEIANLPLLIESQSYDHGTLTVDVFRPRMDKTKLELVDTIVTDQDEFISILQTGCYWKKVKGLPPVKMDLFTNGC